MSENRTRFRLNQNRAPIYEALEQFRKMRVVPFDVPGHKRGRGNPELTAFLGQQCVGVDVNSMKPLDNLCHPVSVIREAEELAADAFGAAHAFLMVGGTTSSVQSMVLTACKRGDEIILPRNVHRSVLNALVLCGAVPVYVNPEVDKRLGISLGMKREQVEKAIREHPNAVAVLVNNPTYYGICSDLRAIVKMAHDAGMLCLADEAHGTHFYFGGGLPVSATFKKPLSKLYEFGKMTWEDVVCICKSIDTLTKAVDMYLLDISCVLILPEYMYLNVSDKEIRYVYCPDANREFQTMLKGLFEFILEHYQHGTDCKNQMRVYEIYQKIIDGNYKIHCLEQLTKESSHSPEKEKTIEFPHIQQDEPVVIEEVAPERVVTEEEKQPVHKIWGIEVGIGICAVLTVYAAAVLLFPEMAVIDMSVYFCIFLILAGCAGGVFLQKKRKKLKEMGELMQLTQEKKYSFVPEEEEEPKNNEKGQKPYEPPKEAAGSNTILLSDYLQKKKELNLTLVLQNGQELESYYEERLLPDTFPCAIGNMAAHLLYSALSMQ